MDRTTADSLIVIDLQVDYFADPALDEHREELVRRTNALARKAQEAGCPVFEVRTVHRTDRSTWTLDMLDDDQGMALEGSDGVEPTDGLDLPGAQVVAKTRDSAFFDTDLQERLTGLRRPAIVGISTESCITATVIDAYARDLRPVLVDDAIASFDDDLHRRCIDRLSDQYRLPVTTVDLLHFEAAAD